MLPPRGTAKPGRWNVGAALASCPMVVVLAIRWRCCCAVLPAASGCQRGQLRPINRQRQLAGYAIGLVSKVDRQEVRRIEVPQVGGPSSSRRGNRAISCANGAGESELGI